MVEVDSTALHQVARCLQIAGIGGLGNAHFQSEQLQQVIDVGPLVRRGLTLAGSDGMYVAVFQNDHTEAGVITEEIDPYAVAGTAGWPNPVPDNLEVWVLALQAKTVTAGDAGVFGGAQFDGQWPDTRIAFGVAGARAVPMFMSDVEVAILTSVNLAEVGTGLLTKTIGWRIPRGVTLRWTSESTGVGTPEYRCAVLLGLFPIGLGQDGIV